MKKIKPRFGKVAAPNLNTLEGSDSSGNNLAIESRENQIKNVARENSTLSELKTPRRAATKSDLNENGSHTNAKTVRSKITSELNPFLQTKEVFAKARLTKIGYRMRADYVEILDIIKKIKKNGYTLEAVLDDALTFYFENSEDGKEAIKKAEIFYS